MIMLVIIVVWHVNYEDYKKEGKDSCLETVENGNERNIGCVNNT